MCFKSIGALAFLVLLYSLESHGGYLITTPRRWTESEETKICVSLSEPPTVEDILTVTLNNKGDDVEEKIVEKHFSFTSGEESTCFRLTLPSEMTPNAKLQITGNLLKTQLNYTREIKIAFDVAKTFVQTDKFLYKPTQEVQFRILTVIGPFLEVSTEMYGEIWVENPSGSRIKEWLLVENPKGLIHRSFTLAGEPEEGIYRVKVSTPYFDTVETTFKVEEYVLPRYEVTIKSPPYVLGTTKFVAFEVCAKYTFGQPVKGNLTFTVGNNGWGKNKITIEREFPISGCRSTNFTSTELSINGDDFFPYALKASATVIESGTNTLLTSDKETIKISRTALRFKDVGVQEYIKPELPFIVEVEITFPDESPVSNEPMGVCIRKICKNFTTNSNGLLKFAIPPHITGTSVVRALNYGRIESGNSWRSIMYESNFVKSPKKYHSPSNSSLVIALTENKINCTPNQDISFSLPVRFSAVNQTSAAVTVQIISRGQIQFFKTLQQRLDSKSSLHISDDLYIEPPIEANTKGLVRGYFTVPIVLSKTVSPKAKVLVWYARDDGEVVSDARDLDFSKCLLNDVTLEWSKDQVRPGDRASMTLSAEPLSLCSIGFVDKSVELLSSKASEITIEKLLAVAEKASVGQFENLQVNDFEYCRKKENETSTLLIPSIVLPEPFLDNPVILPSATNAPGQDETTTKAVPSQDEGRQFPPNDAPTRLKRSFGWRPYYSTDIDSLHMFDNAGVYVFSDYILESRPCDAHYFPFAIPMESIVHRIVAPSAPASIWSQRKERVYFPETWLWNLFTLGDTGSVRENLTLPDTVTEWVGRAVCVHPSQGVGISESSSITTFRDFFVDLTLPPTAKRGEVFPIKISVFNYLNESLPVKVALLQSPDFDIISDGSAEVGSGKWSSCIQAQDKTVHSIKIRPKTFGKVNITVDASVDTNSLLTCGNGTGRKEGRDVVIRPISVEFEGIPKEDTWTQYICSTDLENELDAFETWTMNPPNEIVADSARGWVTASQLLGPTIENLGKLVKMPYGCGEQNMLNFAPNVFVMDYFTATNQTAFVDTAVSHMEKGYQRELNYRHSDGSYSAFGERDESGSTWLTAFVLRCFAQARPYISIDERDLSVSSSWLKKSQMENGCFSSVGKVLHKGMKGGLGDSDSPLLTSFVMISLLEFGEDPSSRAVRESLFCLKADNNTTPYALSVRAYALALAKVPEAQVAVDELLAQAETTTHTMHWSSAIGSSKGLIVETAAYSILALLTLNPTQYTTEVRKVVKWINNKRNGQGGFVSTQDTIVALQALAAFEEYVPQVALSAILLVDMNAHEESFKLDESNKLLLQKADIPSFPNVMTFSLVGQGCILIQGVLRYNIPKPEPSEAFSLSVNTSTEADNGCKTKRIEACASYILPDLKSNMAILEVEIMTGYIPKKSDLKQVVGLGKGLIKRYDVDGSKVMFYVDEFSSKATCVSFRVLREFDVKEAKNATVTVYDYYKPEYALSKSYRLPPSDDCIKTVVEEVESKQNSHVGEGARGFAPPDHFP